MHWLNLVEQQLYDTDLQYQETLKGLQTADSGRETTIFQAREMSENCAEMSKGS